MILNEYGKIAEKQWHWLGKQYSYVILHNFVVMPNHIHGLIEINRTLIENLNKNDNEQDFIGRDRSRPIPTEANNRTKIKSLSELIGAYKTTVSKKIHLTGNMQFKWQRSFHDRIVRNHKEYINIFNYITNNPSNWDKDKFYH